MHLFGEPHIQPQDLAKMKSCLKKPPQSPQCHKRPSLREVIRRASYRRVSTNIHDEQLTMQSETTEHSISDSCSSSRRVSESFRTLFARSQGSSHRIFAGREKEKKSLIKFGDVNIREYEVTAGHHPGGRSGVPIELGWKYNKLDPQPIDEYESHRSILRSSDITERKLTPIDRRRILKEFGITDKEIWEATRHAAQLRNQRRRSLAAIDHDGLFHILEDMRDGLKSVFGCWNERSSTCAVASSGIHPSFWKEPRNFEALFLLEQ